jgi:hypothetical protein
MSVVGFASPLVVLCARCALGCLQLYDVLKRSRSRVVPTKLMSVGFLVVAVLVLNSRPAPAQDCPSAKSGSRGYVVERGDSSKTEVSFVEGAVVRTVFRYEGTTLLETTMFQGLFELDRLDRGQRVVFRPKTDLAKLFPLKVGSSATVEFEVEGAGRPPSSAIRISVKGMDALYIGACKYEVFKIERSESRGGGPFSVPYTDYYAPDLKLVLAKEYRDSGATSATMIKYDRIYSIRQ